MVLYAQQRYSLALRPLLGVGGGEVVGVHIAGYRLGDYVKELREMLYLLLPVRQRLEVLEVAHVLAGEGVARLREAEGRLLLRAAGEQPPLYRHGHGIGHVAPRAPERVVPPGVYAYERVVALRLYVPVVEQKAVRYAAQGLERLGVAAYYRRLGYVRARHDEAVYVVPEQQHVQRRIGQHHSEGAVLAQMREGPGLELFEQDYGLPEALERRGLPVRHAAEGARAGGIPAHYGEGLLVAPLAPPELAHDIRLRQAGEVHTAEALDADNLPGLQLPTRRLYGVAGYLAPPGVEIEAPRPALGAAVRLRVIAPVAYVAKFALAVRAHGEGRHGRARAVVGHGFYYGEARAAVRAVYERVPVPPVVRVQELPAAVRADADVGRDERLHALVRLAGYYLETGVISRFYLRKFHAFYQSEGRGVVL